MPRHRFDPFSFVLGLLAIAVGVVVAIGSLDEINLGVWVAIAAIAAGVGLVPWGRRRYR